MRERLSPCGKSDSTFSRPNERERVSSSDVASCPIARAKVSGISGETAPLRTSASEFTRSESETTCSSFSALSTLDGMPSVCVCRRLQHRPWWHLLRSQLTGRRRGAPWCLLGKNRYCLQIDQLRHHTQRKFLQQLVYIRCLALKKIRPELPCRPTIASTCDTAMSL
jgi:hypothetical protein